MSIAEYRSKAWDAKQDKRWLRASRLYRIAAAKMAMRPANYMQQKDLLNLQSLAKCCAGVARMKDEG